MKWKLANSAANSNILAGFGSCVFGCDFDSDHGQHVGNLIDQKTLPFHYTMEGIFNTIVIKCDFLISLWRVITAQAIEKTSIGLLDHINIPLVERQQKRQGLEDDHPRLFIADVFKGQWTDKVKETVSKSHGKTVSIPANWKNYFQPLDLPVKETEE